MRKQNDSGDKTLLEFDVPDNLTEEQVVNAFARLFTDKKSPLYGETPLGLKHKDKDVTNLD